MSDENPTTASAALRRASNGRWGLAGSILDRREWSGLVSSEGAPGIVLVVVFVAVFVAELAGGGALAWGVSALALAEGRWHLLLAHMFAHGSLGHLLMNAGVLLGLTPVVMKRLGTGPDGWLRYAGLFLLTGLAGAVAYLAVNPTGVTPMVGASGAIFGLWGVAARIGPDGGVAPLGSRQVWREVGQVAQINVVLFLLFFAVARLSGGGGGGGLAWEAHVGGFLFGLLAGPWLLPRAAPQPEAA